VDVGFEAKEVGMYGQMAKGRIDDLIRDAEVFRMTRSTRQARKAERRGRLQRVGTAMAWVVTWPVKR
jgi:hypothetical protein